MTRKIGLAGKSGSGKDLIADYIGERYGFRKIAVADGIREEVKDFLSNALLEQVIHSNIEPIHFQMVWEAYMNSVWDKPTSPEMRVMLQWWGTEYRRSQDPSYWTKKLAEQLKNDDLMVISDIRTPDEMRTVQVVGGEIWFVERPGVESVGIAGHYTEVALEGATFDKAISNDGTIEELKSKIDSYLS